MWPSSNKYQHEIFLSHAVEDKVAIADELCRRLKEKGIKVWYSGDELVGGVDIQKSIEEAILLSRFGAVVFSKTFITKQWTLRELGLLQLKEKRHDDVIISILHEMTMREFSEFSPPLASKFCLQGTRGMDFVVKEIYNKVLEEREARRKSIRRRQSRILLGTIGVIALALFIGLQIYYDKPTDTQIGNAINQRIQTCIATIENKNIRSLKSDGISISQRGIDSVWQLYDAVRSYYRNEYEFSDCLSTISSRKRVESRLHTDLVQMADLPGYGMDSVDAYWAPHSPADGQHHIGFSLINERRVKSSWSARRENDLYIVAVNYENNIRFVNVSLSIPSTTSGGAKRHEMTILGFPPDENYYFEEGSDGEWYLTKVE